MRDATTCNRHILPPNKHALKERIHLLCIRICCGVVQWVWRRRGGVFPRSQTARPTHHASRRLHGFVVRVASVRTPRGGVVRNRVSPSGNVDRRRGRLQEGLEHALKLSRRWSLIWVLLLLILVSSPHLQQRLYDAKERGRIGMGQLWRLHDQSSLRATGE